MEKKTTAPTVAEQKQILETCVHKLEEVNACILAMYPTLSTNLPLSDYTNEELIAHELCEDIFRPSQSFLYSELHSGQVYSL